MVKDKIVFDTKPSARHKDGNGFMHIAISNITKEQVAPYYGREIPYYEELHLDPDKIYYMYRPAKELQKAVNTFNGMPITFEHHVMDADNLPKDYIIGSCGTEARFNKPYLTNSLTFTDGDAIKAIEDNKYKELSAAYVYTPDMHGGMFDGQHYDGVMKDIQANHIALVKEGRAGSDVVVADSKTVKTKDLENAKKESKTMGMNIAKKLKRLLAWDTSEEVQKLNVDLLSMLKVVQAINAQQDGIDPSYIGITGVKKDSPVEEVVEACFTNSPKEIRDGVVEQMKKIVENMPKKDDIDGNEPQEPIQQNIQQPQPQLNAQGQEADNEPQDINKKINAPNENEGIAKGGEEMKKEDLQNQEKDNIKEEENKDDKIAEIVNNEKLDSIKDKVVDKEEEVEDDDLESNNLPDETHSETETEEEIAEDNDDEDNDDEISKLRQELSNAIENDEIDFMLDKEDEITEDEDGEEQSKPKLSKEAIDNLRKELDEFINSRVNELLNSNGSDDEAKDKDLDESGDDDLLDYDPFEEKETQEVEETEETEDGLDGEETDETLENSDSDDSDDDDFVEVDEEDIVDDEDEVDETLELKEKSENDDDVIEDDDFVPDVLKKLDEGNKRDEALAEKNKKPASYLEAIQDAVRKKVSSKDVAEQLIASLIEAGLFTREDLVDYIGEADAVQRMLNIPSNEDETAKDASKCGKKACDKKSTCDEEIEETEEIGTKEEEPEDNEKKSETEEEIKEKYRAINNAAQDCAFVLGRIKDPFAFDSASDIYARALKQLGVDLTGMHPSAYKAILKMARKGSIAQDSAILNAKQQKSSKNSMPEFANLGNIRIG